jgi:ABC-type methionine transport system ATPase subunit
MIRSGSVLI